MRHGEPNPGGTDRGGASTLHRPPTTRREYERLQIELQAAHDASELSELPYDATRTALNDLLVRLKTK